MCASYSGIPGAQPAFLQDSLLGLLIALGNAIVAQVVSVVTLRSGFRQKDRRDMAILVLAFLATLLNTGIDIWVTLKIAQGKQLDAVSLGDHAGYDTVLARELMALIVPGYLILPYLFLPMVEHVLPYFLGIWFVRSRRTS